VHDFLSPELDPDAAPPESVVTIPPGRLIGSVVFSGFTVVVLAFVIVLVVSVTVGGTGWLLFAILPGIIGSAGFYFSRITKSLRYTIAGTADGVRVGFGLLSISNETLPPGRIHAVNVSQPVVWRPFGWWQIRINKAGHSTNQGAAGQASTTTLPVGTITDVARVLELILPGYDGDEQRALIGRGMLASGREFDGFINAPRRAAWLRPFSWRRTGYTVNEGVALIRRGVVARELILVPLARLQSVGVRQGPVQRMLRLASLRLHTVSGPVFATLPVVDLDESVRMFDSVSAGAVASAQSDTSHRWNGHQPAGVAS
jgi:putative membrane protein